MSLFKTHNEGAMAPDHSNRALEFFSKGGNIVGNTYYGDTIDVHEETKKHWFESFISDPLKAMKLLFWSRDPRGGAGHRRLMKELLHEGVTKSMAVQNWVKANLHLIPKYGRYDDVKALYDTPLEKEALEFLSSSIENPLCAKWMDRKDSKLRDHLGLTSKQYRKLVVKHSNAVETLMSEKRWKEVNYEQVPSIAGIRYTSAFYKHDRIRFLDFIKEHGLSGTVAFPHEIMRLYNVVTPEEIIQSFFNNLPKLIKQDERILPMVDVSGSMCVEVSGSITAMDVSISLGLYCSDQIPGPFNRSMMTFSSDPTLINWSGKDIVRAIQTTKRAPWGMSTDISKALDSILTQAKTWGVPQQQMPTMLLILSDMQFDESVGFRGGWDDEGTITTVGKELAETEKALERWVREGYNKPAVVYWNLQNYDGQPSYSSENVAFISGFSPAILKSVLECTEKDKEGNVTKLDPVEVMDKAIEKYSDVITP